MKKLVVLLLFTLTLFLLTSCGGGGGGAVSGMAGKWVSTVSTGGVSADYILDIVGPDENFNGSLDVDVPYAGVVTVAPFSGSRSGNAVELTFYGTSLPGKLSGNRLTFEKFINNINTGGGPVTFRKR